MFNKKQTGSHLRNTALFGAVFFLCVGAVGAKEVVVLKGVKQPVEVQRGKGWEKGKVGMELMKGHMVRTGKKGEASLVMADGTKMVVKSETRMTIEEVAPNRVYGLGAGRVRSFVKKLKKDSKFEIKTPLAAASVRGTEFEVGYNEGTNDGYLKVDEGSVNLSQEGQEMLVQEGEKVDFTAGGLGSPQTTGSSSQDRSAVRREVGLGMSKEEVLAAAAEEMRRAEYQEGKTLIDVNGTRVRLEEYIIRKPVEVAAADRDKAFKLVVLNERDSRFDYFYYRGLFNTTLPDNLSVALSEMGGILGTTSPTYYLTSYEMGQSNTQDTIKDMASGGHLVKIEYDGTNYTLTDPTNAANTRTVSGDEQSVVDNVTYHKVYDPVNDRFQTLTDAQYKSGDYNPVVYDAGGDKFRVMTGGDTLWKTRFNSYSHQLNTATKQSYTAKATVTNTLAIDLDCDWTYAGGTLLAFAESPSGGDKLHTRISLFYGDGTKEVVDTYIMDDEGKIGPVSAFNNITTGAGFKAELVKWNYEQVTQASEFQGRKIDLVVEPKILTKSGLIK
jgi:hypothetical protein